MQRLGSRGSGSAQSGAGYQLSSAVQTRPPSWETSLLFKQPPPPLLSTHIIVHEYTHVTNEDWDDEDWDARNFLKKIWKIGGKWHGRVMFRFRHVNDRTPVSFASLFQLLRATIQITFTVRVISEFKRGACVRRIRILGSINVRGRLWNRSNAVHGLSTGSRLIP